ncbi:MAG: L-threonylcarbamoyladenylate synthase [Thermaerobacter sp.]|nr:L-threonylcarbamoyladenylate synthase [Thermaerobacter sp.]
MHTRIVGTEGIAEAVAVLRAGGLVAFPTETVYGLGADATNATACAEIFRVKGRPADNPLILHVSGAADLMALTEGPLPGTAVALTQRFWPGPLTVVVRSNGRIPALVRAGLDTVAVRAPNHPVAQALIRGLRRPVAAPSANRSGRPSPTRAADVLDDLAGRLAIIVDGGMSAAGLESSVVDCTTPQPVLLRPGAIGYERLRETIPTLAMSGSGTLARSPGMKYRHYAPEAPVVWIRSHDERFVRHALAARGPDVVLIAPDGPWAEAGEVKRIIGLGGTLEEAGRRFYAALREADREHPAAIVVVWDATGGMGLAISNRLTKASAEMVVP